MTGRILPRTGCSAAEEERGFQTRKPNRILAALVRDKITLVAALILFFVLTSAALADVLVNMGLLPAPNAQNLLLRNSPPGVAPDGTFHILGTDQLGRDELSRLLFGARVSLAVGLATVLVSAIVGIALGLVTGYYRGWVDDVVMRLVDIQMGFPTLLLALAVLYIAGPSFLNLILVLALTRWPLSARITRGLTLSLRETQFIESARAIGASNLRIMVRHLLPNLASPIIVLSTMEFGRAMLSEAGLSFLGMGIQPPDSSWGLMLSQGRPYMTTAWWLVAFPGLSIFAAVLPANLLATWLRGISDPAQRWRWVGGGKGCGEETQP